MGKDRVLIDYRELLKGYIWHVGMCEGTDFMDALDTVPKPLKKLNKKQKDELKRLSDEVWKG